MLQSKITARLWWQKEDYKKREPQSVDTQVHVDGQQSHHWKLP